MFGCFTGRPLKSIFSCFCTPLPRPAFLIRHLFSSLWAFVESLSQLKTRLNSKSDSESKTKSGIYFWVCFDPSENVSNYTQTSPLSFTSAPLSFFTKPPLFFFSIAQSPLLFPLLTLFSCSLIRCKLIAPHMGDGTRLVSILIMVCGLAAGNTLPICSQRICQMIGVYTPHPLRSVCHNATSYISITHRIPRQTSPKTHTNTRVWALIKTLQHMTC